ncbi:hypothetical protein NFI96_003470 [Prochilodus magdalenae]|nr:hypothetical protein NFI96_003470 [Prochilodus magdalenae]
MIITDMRPLSMVEDEGFNRMICTFNPGYTLPSRTHFTKLMERKYEETFMEVRTAINTNHSKLALTADIWTSVASEACLGITCHYITDDLRSTQSAAFESAPLQAFQLTATEHLQERWREETSFSDAAPNTVLLATALDPRFRRLKFLSPEEVLHVQTKVQTMALAEKREMDVQQHCSSTSTNTPATITDIQGAVVSSMGHPVSAAPLADGCTTQDYMHTDRYHDCP